MNIVFGLLLIAMSVVGFSYFIGWMIDSFSRPFYTQKEPIDHLHRLSLGLQWVGTMSILIILIAGFFFGIYLICTGGN